VLVACVLIAGGLAACGHAVAPAPVPKAGPIASNVLRPDYAGSSTCGDCHAAIYQTWATSPMRNMTRDAATAKIQAPFDGAVLRVGAETCTMTMVDGMRGMIVNDKTGTHRFHITKVIGGRYREDFVGVETGGDGLEHVLPATFVFSSRSWRYKGYSVMIKERPVLSWRGVWSQECIGCHNTLPQATLLFDELYGPTLPPYQGKMSDRVLPASRAWAAQVVDPPGLARALAQEIQFLGGTPPASPDPQTMLPAAATTMEHKLDGKHLVELGIGCEACHNGARDHAANPAVKPTFQQATPLFRVAPPAHQTGTQVQWINHTCAKCHTVLFTHYPFTWEGGLRLKGMPGGSSTTSGEGRDFQLGGCSSQMACTHCHDPHTQDPPEKLAAMATQAGDHLCTECHTTFATEKHTHHQTVGCIACHMPKKNMGLDYALDRYHRIGSPTEPRRVLGDRPLECALCHADKSVEQIVSTMEQWWGKHYDREALQKLYGADLSVNVLRATLVMGKPHEQAAAAITAGEAKQRDAIELIVPLLWHDYPLVRFFAQRALQTITGDPVAIDVGGAAVDVRRAAEAWLQQRK
jgi:predicted CXXCH cytochrome family protein